MIDIKYFVHGTTTDNLEKKASGWSDCGLSKKGRQQARDLSRKICETYFDVVFCSDLIRAIESTKIVFGGLVKMAGPEIALRECNYGDYNGKDSKLIDYATHIYEKFPNGESLKDVEERVAGFLQYLKKHFDGKSIAIVAHRAPQLALEVLLNNKTWEQAIAEDWRNTNAWQPGWDYTIQ